MGRDTEVRARQSKLLALLEKSTGRRPLIYATNEAYDRFVKNYGLANPLWLRDLWHEPVGCQIWQFATRGHLEAFADTWTSTCLWDRTRRCLGGEGRSRSGGCQRLAHGSPHARREQ